MTVTEIGPGRYVVRDGERRWTVAIAGLRDNRWVWVEGQVARLETADTPTTRSRSRTSHHDLTSPMPATVVKVMAEVGQTVARGDTLIMLEAMKMELPVRAPSDGVVSAVHCRAGELVQPGTPLIELE